MTGAAFTLDELLDQGIKPHAEAVAAIVISGEIAVVVWKLSATGQLAARFLGWDGQSQVFQMGGAGRRRMIEQLQDRDPVTVRWLKGGRKGRIFVMSGDGTLLVNYDAGHGFSLEPGSTNQEYLS